MAKRKPKKTLEILCNHCGKWQEPGQSVFSLSNGVDLEMFDSCKECGEGMPIRWAAPSAFSLSKKAKLKRDKAPTVCAGKHSIDSDEEP